MIYDNPSLASWDSTGEAPAGSIAVKENFADADGATLEALTVMRRVAGYHPEGGDWFWAQYGADGTVMAAGRVEMCVSCHAGSTTDYVFTDPSDRR